MGTRARRPQSKRSKIAQAIHDRFIGYMVQQGPSNKMERRTPTELDRKYAIGMRGVEPGSMVRLVGEQIWRKVETITPDYRLQIAYFTPLVCPTQVLEVQATPVSVH